MRGFRIEIAPRLSTGTTVFNDYFEGSHLLFADGDLLLIGRANGHGHLFFKIGIDAGWHRSTAIPAGFPETTVGIDLLFEAAQRKIEHVQRSVPGNGHRHLAFQR